LCLGGVDNVTIEGAGAFGDDSAKHHVAINKVTPTGLYSAHRLNEPWIIFCGREQQQWTAFPTVVTKFGGHGLGWPERSSAGHQKDHCEGASDELSVMDHAGPGLSRPDEK
jgi:hypothetical protein